LSGAFFSCGVEPGLLLTGQYVPQVAGVALRDPLFPPLADFPMSLLPLSH
jgi:hypothetical protein